MYRSKPSPPVPFEVLLVSPFTVGAFSPAFRERQIRPANEASSADHVALVVPLGAVDPDHGIVQRLDSWHLFGWPAAAGQAHIGRTDHALRTLEEPIWPLIQRAKHVILPFDLRYDHGALSRVETGLNLNRHMLENIFPKMKGYSLDGRFLTILLDEMPPKPWPKTVAGLPLHLAPQFDPHATPVPFGRLVDRRNGSIAQDLHGRGMKSWTPIFEAVRHHFSALRISITHVIYWGNFITIVLEHRTTDLTRLPWKAANIGCQYLYDDEMGRPALPKARHQSDLTSGDPDESQYQTLQPGLRLTSGCLPSNSGVFIPSTTGVLVRDDAGDEYMTASLYGFPDECGTEVVHARPMTGRKIGQVHYQVPQTDIVLVRLQESEPFHNETFKSKEIIQPTKLGRLINPIEVKSGNSFFLDSPDTGCIDGTLQVQSFQRVLTHGGDHGGREHNWVSTTWFYTGQETASSFSEGMCGSPVCTENGHVVGFFRYAPKEGRMKDWCCATAADELISRDFTLVDTAGRR
ncbi:hypothetical protein FZEAL_2384 [Fusarium zealandicum]|uniref:Uncharacterized protein n=1 Tax=Fusarium zealandicum TaxID=1053134 RepID=A0A8H4URL0_9HYPO|nr:hypothetical protein FZEAL_2384 [Fusarium zealandicum]